MPDKPPTTATLDNGDHDPPKLGLRPREAAKSLGICERLLWSKTNAGEIPHVRIGRAIIYPIDLLREYLAQQAQKKGGNRR
ncbi:MAG: helix-turn-helix domain-containing protein [Phycisphaerae bacterium]|nr:helix-turn-helix domain-containing protein [Phycisphaerae bacterium]